MHVSCWLLHVLVHYRTLRDIDAIACAGSQRVVRRGCYTGLVAEPQLVLLPLSLRVVRVAAAHAAALALRRQPRQPTARAAPPCRLLPAASCCCSYAACG